jgi:uncharacterized cupin superfamily protein
MNARIDAAVEVARRHADAVDVEARFPREAFEELRAQKLLGLLLPVEAGGEASRVSGVAQICYALGRACSSTAMIYAMHQTNVACTVQHADATPKFSSYPRRIGQEQMLVASSTTEGSNGAIGRTSGSPINSDANGISLSRDSSVLSYGANADAIVSTARRAPAPIARNAMLSRSEDGSAFTLIRDCTAGLFEWRYGIDEAVYILEGSVIVHDAAGGTRRLEAGATAFFPSGSRAVWRVDSYVRKVAFCRKRMARGYLFARKVARAALQKSRIAQARGRRDEHVRRSELTF